MHIYLQQKKDMDFSSIFQIIFNFMITTFPNLDNTSQTTTYDIAGFVTNDNITWNFITINGSTNATSTIFTEQIRPLWFTVAADNDFDGSLNRIIYKRDSLISPYIFAQMGKDGAWNIQLLSDIKNDSQCFYDLTSLYCFDGVDQNRMIVSRISFCNSNEICVEKSKSLSYQSALGKAVQTLEYNSCQTTIQYKNEQNVRNLYNLQSTVDGKLDDKDLMFYNYSTFLSSSFSSLNLTNNGNLSFLLQYRFRKSFTPTCEKEKSQTCLEAESNKTMFEIFFYCIISLFVIYIGVNIAFLSLMFYRRRKMIQKLSQRFLTLKTIEKSEERNSEKRQTTPTSTKETSNKETENKSHEKSLKTARQPRIFDNESMITADLPSSRKQMEETTREKNDS